jgi:hypothetical protein
MLVEHARNEMQRAGLFDADADYDGMIGTAVLELVKKFAEQGHSGFSAQVTLEVFDKVARFKTLTPITSNADEWMEVGNGNWQNRRQSSVFSKDGGQTWYDIDEPKQ